MPSTASITQTSPILTEASGNSVKVASDTKAALVTKKRKSNDFESDDNGSSSFVAKSLTSRAATTFDSVTLIARACLPLAWLHSSAQQVFHAIIPDVEEWEQRVLVVRRTPNGGLYALEQVSADTYIACQLQNWVTEAWCHNAAIGNIFPVKVDDLLPSHDAALRRSHSRTASISSTTATPAQTSPKKPKNRRGALARMSILGSKEANDGLETATATNSPVISEQLVSSDTGAASTPSAGVAVELQHLPLTSTLVQEPLPTTPAAQIDVGNPFEGPMMIDRAPVLEPEILPVSELPANLPILQVDPLASEHLRTQYFEHLYTTKTSLAFYVKGPLSRARAHVRSAEEPSKAIAELSSFYEQSILPTRKVDTKYRESLAKVVKDLPVAHENEAEMAVADAKKKKSRKRPAKLGKDCLWPEEESFIARWWRNRDIKGKVGGSDHADEIRQELGEIRMRETMMQMLLILEVMLLETAATKLAESVNTEVTAQSPGIKTEPVDEEASAAIRALASLKQQQKKEKKRNWAAEIDTIVDRLCIWHTVSLDESVTNTGENKLSAQEKNTNDVLRDFCKDVLLPFYSAKIPEQIKSTCRKLGGPEISPKRVKPARPAASLHKSSSSLSSMPKAKPGQVLSKRTLERVLSEDHQLLRHASPSTTFSRAPSMTAPTIPNLKREPSERPVSRAGMLSKSASFSNREIDLVADQRAHEAKRRKLDRLAQQKKELDAAIDALKKPDRRAAASQIMDEVEERRRRELEKRTAVQITATPRARRTQSQAQFADEPELPPMPLPRLVPRESEATMMIPSSTIKPRARPSVASSAGLSRSSATKRAVLAAIHETPSRGIESRTSNPLELPVISLPSVEEDRNVSGTPDRYLDRMARERLPSSELAPPSSQSRTSPSRSDAGVGLHMRRSGRPVLFTPIKKSEARLDQIFRDAPEVPEKAGRMMDRVMGGKGRGIDESFEPVQARLAVPVADLDDGDIYDRLGWNDDFDL
jgi:hypothetical protein